MNKAELKRYIQKYVPYSNNPKWVDSYMKIAPVKAYRTIKLLKKYKDKNARLLDCGFGVGLSLYYISQYFKNSEGIDTDPENVKTAKEQFKKLRCKTEVKVYDGKKLPYKDNYFDVVLSVEVWEHAVDTRTMLKEIARVLKPDGILHITTANKLWPIEPHYQLPFLSYLPYWLADWYVKKAGRADYYHDIHLPTYPEFRRSIEEFFSVSDVTFDSLINYKEYGLDKERGKKIVFIGEILKTIKSFENFFLLSFVANAVFGFLINISLGWLIIGYPKKNK